MVGETDSVLPVPEIVVVEPHEPVPHWNTLLVPTAPPVAVKVVELPEQIVVAVVVTLVGAVGSMAQPSTVTVTVAQVVVAVQQSVPFLRTQ